jgi:hypothetical protein
MAQALHLIEESTVGQLKVLQEETRFSYEHLTLILSKTRKYQSCQRSQNPDPIEEDSLDYGLNAVEVQAPHSSFLPQKMEGSHGGALHIQLIMCSTFKPRLLTFIVCFIGFQKLPLEQEMLGQVLLL